MPDRWPADAAASALGSEAGSRRRRGGDDGEEEAMTTTAAHRSGHVAFYRFNSTVTACEV